jgi:hypothetical protein
MTMIEKVARAICVCAERDPDLQGVQSPFGDITPMPAGYRQWQNYEAEARAAIEAMREPTREMVFAAWNEMDGGTNKNGPLVRESSTCHVDNDGPLQSDTAFEVWQAMIDTALKETA